MDLGKAFTYVTEDERWTTKLGIGTGIALAASFIPLLPALLLSGYELDISRRYANDEEPLLPEWEDFGRYFMDGLNVTLAKIIYTSPLILLFCIVFGIFLVVPLAASGGNGDEIAGVIAGVGFLAWMVLACVGLLMGIAITLLTPAINIQYIREGNLGACLRVGEIIRLTRENMSEVIMVVVGVVGAWLVISVVSSVISFTICGPFIILWVGMAYIRMVSGHLVGQVMANMNGKSKEMAYDM